MDKSVLIIENIDEEWEIFREVCDHRGDEAVRAESEMKALPQFEAGEFDMVIIEALLPTISGYELCQMIRETAKGKKVPIILVGSIFASFRVAHQVRTKYGATDVFARPYDFRDMEMKLNLHLDGIKPERPKPKVETAENGDMELDFTKVNTAIPFTGSLELVPFPRVLTYFSFIGEDGILHVENGQITKAIHIVGGRPTMVTGTMRGQSLGQILLDQGKIDEPTFETAIDQVIQTEKRLGETLIDMGAISSHDLFTAIGLQTREKIIETFAWDTGSYSFALDPNPKQSDFPLDINLFDLVLDGIARHWDKNAVLAEMKGKENLHVFPVRNGYDRAVASVQSPKVHRILNKINGRYPLKDLIREVKMDLIDAMNSLLALMILEAAVLAPQETAVAPGQDRIYKTLGAKLILDETPEGTELREDIDQRYKEIKGKRARDVFELDADEPDFNLLRDQFLSAIRAVGEKQALVRADELTKARASKLQMIYTRAFDVASDPERVESIIEGLEAEAPFASTHIIESEKEYRLGVDAFRHGKYNEAMPHFQQAVDLYEDAAEYHAYLGRTQYLLSAKTDEHLKERAMGIVEHAISVNPHLSVPYQMMGMIMLDEGNIDKAEQHLELAFENDKDSTDTLRTLFEIYRQRNQSDIASIVSQAPPEYESELAEIYERLHLMNFFDLLDADEGTDYDALRRYYFNKSAEIRSSEYYDKLPELGKEQADEIFQRMTEAYTVLSNTETKREYLKSLEPPSPDAVFDSKEGRTQYEQGRSLLKKKNYSAAFRSFQQAVEKDPAVGEYRAYMAWAYYMDHKRRQDGTENAIVMAKEWIRHALVTNPNCSTCFVTLAQLCLENGRKLLAAELIELALDIDPDKIAALRLFRKIHSRFGGKSQARYLKNDQLAIGVLRHQLELDLAKFTKLNHFQVLGLPRGKVSKSQVVQAVDELKKKHDFDNIYGIAPDDVRNMIDQFHSLVNKAASVLANAEEQEAYIRRLDQSELEQKFNVDGIDDAPTVFNKAKIMIREGMLDQAIGALKRARNLDPTNDMYPAWLGFAIYQSDKENPTARGRAREMIQQAIDMNNKNADALVMLGKIFHYEGDTNSARARYSRALEIDPQHAEAGIKLALLTKRSEEENRSLVEIVKDKFSFFKKKK